jgi:hypothetical protein
VASLGFQMSAPLLHSGMLFKASLPVCLALFMGLAFANLEKRKHRATSTEQTTELQQYKAALVVFSIFVVSMLHPRCVAHVNRWRVHDWHVNVRNLLFCLSEAPRCILLK